MLIGREREQRSIENLLAQARAGVSGALVIRGEAGIGKTAVLEHAAAGSGIRALRCTGVESEHDLPFAGLEQLFRPVIELIERLPGPQAAALGSAFGLGPGRAEDRLLLGLATLGLLAEAAEEEPLLCLVDDLQWLDGPSAQALLFAARRLGAEGVVMLFAVRDDPADWFEAPGVEELTMSPLSDTAAREVLAARRGPVLGRTAEQRLLREAAGNPLALLELPVRNGAAGEATGIEAAFRARVMGLPRETRQLLLLAAVSDGDDVGAWPELMRLVDLPPTARLAAVEASLIGDLDAIVFRHPLARAAVHNACSRAERAEAHRVLASGATDRLSRISHLAAAAQQSDEALAAELEEAGTAAARRGAFASAASVLARAAELSSDAEGRIHRLIAAAQAYLDAGDADTSSRLADEALGASSDVSDKAGLAAVKGSLELQRGTPGTAYELLVRAAHGISAENPARALELQAQAMIAALIAGWSGRAFSEADEFLKRLPPTGLQYERFCRASLKAILKPTPAARQAARDTLLEALAAGAAPEDFIFISWAAHTGSYLGDLRSASELTRQMLAFARSAGSFNTLPLALLAATRLNVVVRAFDEAEEWAREGIEITRQLGQENLETCFSSLLVRCLAARGRIDECRELGDSTLRRALAHGIAVAVEEVRLAFAELELSLGHGTAARELIEMLSHPLWRLAAVPYLAEAWLLSGDPEPPEAALSGVEMLTAYGEQAQDPVVLGFVARSRALLAPTPELAEPLFIEALGYQTSQAFERARTALAYGEFLRRGQRRTEARVHLREALATFEGLDVPLWAERARAELEATGITARKRDPSTLDELTPQEARVAKLVAGGASNREVASQLFLSPKTIEYHLRNVFMKLGVSSRVQLAHLPLAPAAAGGEGSYQAQPD